jgi:hypothetical protein
LLEAIFILNRFQTQRAARLFLMDISVQVNATPEQLGVQASQLSNLNLNADDQRTLTSHLAAFRFQFDHLVAEYNRRATWADRHGVPADTAFFNQQMDDLVQPFAGPNWRGSFTAGRK